MGSTVGIRSFPLPCYPTLGTNFSVSLSSWAQTGECLKIPKLGSGRAQIQIQLQGLTPPQFSISSGL